MSKLTHPFTEAAHRLHKEGVPLCHAFTTLARETNGGARKASARQVSRDIMMNYSSTRVHPALIPT